MKKYSILSFWQTFWHYYVVMIVFVWQLQLDLQILYRRIVHGVFKSIYDRYVAVNMGAIPSNLLESELFGYEKGAFTGAGARKKGQFELANRGTLFLDEIAEIDLNLQAKLLRALQEREFLRLGGEQVVKFDARIIILNQSIHTCHFLR